jgi:hypothetical protein
MTPSELAEAKAELAELKAVRLARLKKGALRGVGNGSERIEREPAAYADLANRIRELDREIRMGEGTWFGTLHLR